MSARFIDTHCHLLHGRLRSAGDVLGRARAVGVTGIICAAGDLDESHAAVELAARKEGVFALAGIHPHDAQAAPQRYLDELERLTASPGLVAIGEIGLDYHYDYSPRADQRRVLAEQLALAGRLGRKVAIHTRQALDDTLAILADSPVAGADVVFHSCTEEPAGMERVLASGAMVSFSGIVTFGNARSLQEAARLVGDDRLLIETDAPYLSPEPVRAMKTNEPANVVHVAAFLAELRGCGVEHVARVTTVNAEQFFGLPAGG